MAETNQKNRYNVIGVMSGTSLDGVDLAYCEFNLVEDKWQYKIRRKIIHYYLS